MANIGVGSGLAGFAEGFAQSFTRAKEIEAANKARQDAFATEQLIVGAYKNPKQYLASPKAMSEVESAMGDRGPAFNEFITKLAADQEGESAAAFLTAPAPGQAPQAAPAASPEAQMITGQGTVLAPPAGQPAFQPAQFGAEAPTSAEGVPLVEEPQALIAAPPKSRAQQIQERLQPGVTYQRKFKKTGETVTLSGKEGKEALGYQLWQSALDSGLDTVTAAEQAQQQIVDSGGVPPKFINDLAMARTKQQLIAGEAAAREVAVRGVQVTHPRNAEEYRQRAASGTVGGYAIGRDLKEEELLAAHSQGFPIVTFPDGSRVAAPREEALTMGLPILEPKVLLAEQSAQKIRDRTTNQEVSAAQVRDALNDVIATNALDLFVVAGPGLGGAVKADIEAQTKNRLRLYNLRRHGDERAIALDALIPLATAFVKAGGDTGQITEPDKKQWKDFFGRVAAGTAPRQEAEARITKLLKMVNSAQPGGGTTTTTTLPVNREGTDRANTTNSTTSTTLPYNARVVDVP